jgi:lytic murein transglycosylase
MPNGTITRRALLAATASVAALSATGAALAQSAQMPFDRWVANFRARALAKGVRGETYDAVMRDVKPDTRVYALDRSQPEFTEQLWQYLNRRVSDWRIITGKERLREHGALLARIEKDYGVDRHILLAVWGMESSFGDVIDNMKYMRPVIPALAALAWGEPRRRSYWEQELINALIIVDRGWATPKEMIGSWAGAMGHTQWMPEVWLRIGVDYDRDGHIKPFGKPDDALAGTARYLAERGKWVRGEPWGTEVKLPAGFNTRLADQRTWRGYTQWHGYGIARADSKPFARPNDRARLWLPVARGPAFLLGQNFYAVRSYNPSSNYTLAICHLADRIRGEGPFAQQFPGGERALTLAEVQEVQKRLTAAGFDTAGVDGRVGLDTMRAVAAFQRKVGIEPADGYAGLKELARLRQGF